MSALAIIHGLAYAELTGVVGIPEIRCVGYASLATSPQIVGFIQQMLPPDEAEAFVAEFDQIPKMLPSGLPKLYLNGREDNLSREKDLTKYIALAAPPRDVRFVEGVGHMFEGKESQAASIVLEFVRNCVSKCDAL